MRRDGTNLGDALAKIPTNRGAVFTRFYAGDTAFLAGWNDWNFSAKEEARRAGEAMNCPKLSIS